MYQIAFKYVYDIYFLWNYIIDILVVSTVLKWFKARSPEIKANNSGWTEGITAMFYTNVASSLKSKIFVLSYFSERVNAPLGCLKIQWAFWELYLNKAC